MDGTPWIASQMLEYAIYPRLAINPMRADTLAVAGASIQHATGPVLTAGQAVPVLPVILIFTVLSGRTVVLSETTETTIARQHGASTNSGRVPNRRTLVSSYEVLVEEPVFV